MAETFDPRVYGCRINLEHLRGILPDGIFKRYGDVAELKAEKIDDDSALKGKWALFAKITPTDDLIAMNKAAQMFQVNAATIDSRVKGFGHFLNILRTDDTPVTGVTLNADTKEF